MALKNKKIILAVTGSIAAYKTPQLVRLLKKAGAEVQVLITAAGGKFVSELSLATVSGKAVLADVADGSTWNNHVALGLWADAMVIAPCSANTLAKLAHGLCDNIVSAVYLSARCPIFIAPAMDEDMWKHPATRANLATVKKYGNNIIPVGTGELASGLVGEGRMAEPEDIAAALSHFFTQEQDNALKGVQAIVTAGPTYERLDPVRFIGNYSSGKMGVAIADALAEAGASVTLVAGPIQVRPANADVRLVQVESAEEMYEVAHTVFPDCHIAVLAAAVADYRPRTVAEEKIKKNGEAMSLDLEKTPDILASLGKIKQPWQTLTGFALETNNEMENARKKLQAKNADMIVLNSLRDEGAGFGHDTNKITILTADGGAELLPLMTKKEVAKNIVDHIIQLRYARETA